MYVWLLVVRRVEIVELGLRYLAVTIDKDQVLKKKHLPLVVFQKLYRRFARLAEFSGVASQRSLHLDIVLFSLLAAQLSAQLHAQMAAQLAPPLYALPPARVQYCEGVCTAGSQKNRRNFISNFVFSCILQIAMEAP